MASSFMDTLRNFLSRPSGMAMNTMGKSRSVPHLNVRMPIDTWTHVVMTCLRGWNLESISMWQELSDYRLKKASHCKDTNNLNGHEFVIYEFTHNKKQKLEFRTDRSVGEHKGSMSISSCSSPSVDSFVTDFTDFEAPSPHPGSQSSRLSLPLISIKGGISKMTGSIRRIVRHLSEDSLPRSSAISSNQYLAADTITRISGHPPHSKVLRTITFKGDRAKRPNLWDVMILVNVVHNDSATYTLLGRQCYWFADTIFGLLEKWASIHKNGIVRPEQKRKRWKGLASTGRIGVVPVYSRDIVHIGEIWDKFMKERQIMDNQRVGYEQVKKEEIRKANELAEQVQRLKREQKTERRLMEEQEEMIRRLEEERCLLNQQIADQRRQLEEKDRQWQMGFQPKDEEAHRHFKQMEHRIVRTSISI